MLSTLTLRKPSISVRQGFSFTDYNDVEFEAFLPCLCGVRCATRNSVRPMYVPGPPHGHIQKPDGPIEDNDCLRDLPSRLRSLIQPRLDYFSQFWSPRDQTSIKISANFFIPKFDPQKLLIPQKNC